MMDERDRRSYRPTPTCLPISLKVKNEKEDESENSEKENEFENTKIRANIPDTRTVAFEI